jgi:hypothetical protein
MSRRRNCEASADPRWSEFAARFCGNPALQQDALYALPVALIEAVRQEVPRLWSKDDVQFERELARVSPAGFFLQRPFRFPVLPAPDPDVPDESSRMLAERGEAAGEQLRMLLAEELQGCGKSKLATENYFKRQAANQQKVLHRQRGYVGWLVTDRGFHLSRQAFWDRWGLQIRKTREMPRLPISYFGEKPPSVTRKLREFYSEYISFFRHWCLDSFVTWDLPLPMRAELVGPSLYYLPNIAGAGLTLFVPWYLLVDQDLQLRDLADHHRGSGATSHLREWLDTKSAWGYERFGFMLQLYVYLELALKRRYGERVAREIGRLDQAFAQFRAEQEGGSRSAVTGADSIRKIRQQMQKRLKQCRARPRSEPISE